MTRTAAAAASNAAMKGTEKRRDTGVGHSSHYSRWPTLSWHLIHESPLPVAAPAGSMDAVMSAWQFRHACSATA